MLALSTATMMLVLGMPGMALPVLFREISLDLGQCGPGRRRRGRVGGDCQSSLTCRRQ
jgi:hypothetical protein